MKAVRFHAQGAAEVLQWEEAPDPVAGPGEVLIRLHAASVNRLDLWVRSTLPGLALPHIPGSDGAGEVVAGGTRVTSPQPGDRVVIYPGLFCGECESCLRGEQSTCRTFRLVGRHTDGTYAELIAVPARNACVLPEALSYQRAAALPVTFLTAWHMLISRAALRAGETVLIVGASGGLGSAGVQIAKLAGALVIAVAGGEEKAAKLRALGADHVIDYRAQPISEEARRLTAGRGVDVAFEHVGPATFEESLRSLTPGGRLVIAGATTGPVASFTIRDFYTPQLSILGSMSGTPREFGEVLLRAAAEKLAPVIDRVLPRAQAVEAHRALEAGEVFGKIVLTPDADG